ncbi:MAG: valyl-tRNA synthetase [Thermosediminibacterales bacterium]|nr:valyl-tRNA synthetase [Thermosediminibacterales bacterium]
MGKAANISTVYDPKKVEDKWYDYWLEGGYFTPEIDYSKRPFTIVIPPPNVTGQLHMGHALNNTMQDIIIRKKRMEGIPTLWLPGTDHAGIATEAKVKEQIAEEGLSKYDLGREEFLKRVWQWKEKYGGTIIKQLKKLGASCDWSRERFTMDEGCSEAVREVFVRLYEKGLIYRGDYIVNWCPTCHTTLSDIEVEHIEEEGKLWHIKYPFKDGSGYVTVATTRPETMLGDTCVAVHPDDERYKELVGRTLILPILNREIPIVADEYVDPEFGSGAVKVTPAHDPNDFEIGIRHNQEPIVVIDDEGKMTKNAGKYEGMDRYECRKTLIKDLDEQGYLLKVEDHYHNVGHCYRCDTTIEPMISKQWFVKMKPLAEPAIEVVKEGKIRFIPERFTKIYINWLENIKDWCISRQLWWGHRIPAWYCKNCGEIIVARETPKSCSKCGGNILEQDPDVLDTWFSSALWPFSTLGWPRETEDLKYFYPTSVLVTGYDIIFFWVARMIFSGLEFMKDIPFKDVVVTGLVRDSLGRKMSKSLGNGIDPLEVIEKYGADTLRFTLSTGNTPGNDLRFYWERVESSRNFANKIWNASRFVMMNLEDFTPKGDMDTAKLTIADKWILSRYNSIIKEVTKSLDSYEFGIAAQKLYDFIWSEFCDWYIELTKPRLYGEDMESRVTAQHVLWLVLSGTMKLLHPFMPFITEEIWQHLPHEGESIMVSKWPEFDEANCFPDDESKMYLIMEAIRSIRNIRGELNVAPSRKAEAVVRVSSDDVLEILKEGAVYIKNLANVSKITFIEKKEDVPKKAMTAVISGAEIYMPLEGLVDIDKEIERLQKELKNLKSEIERANKKLSNKGFLEKAPKDVVEKERKKQKDYTERYKKVEERLKLFM